MTNVNECPNCGSNDVDCYDADHGDDYILEYRQCFKCENQWTVTWSNPSIEQA